MVTTTELLRGSARKETASLIPQSLVGRLSSAARRPGAAHPMMNPTVFVPVKRGHELTYVDVVASKV